MKVALIIIYNHQYNKNIEIIEDLYNERFSNIFHLVPFYSGNKKNVISVYENSYYFQGYVAQGLKHYFNDEFEHYIFLGDDVLLNPKINENNYKKDFKLTEGTSFIPDIINIHEVYSHWPRVREAYSYNIKYPGVEIEYILPKYEIAVEKFKNFGLELKPLNFNQIWKKPKLSFKMRSVFKMLIFLLKKTYYTYNKKKFNLPYPVIGSYSDIFVVDSKTIKEFGKLCGIFAATDLFVELGLPTALVLSANSIVTERDLNFKGKALWTTEDFEILKRYDNNLNELLSDFPKENLFLHPIKLSKWKKKK